MMISIIITGGSIMFPEYGMVVTNSYTQGCSIIWGDSSFRIIKII